jgi:hypothetical protein
MSELVEQVLGMMAVWILWTLAEHFIEASRWIWMVAAIVAGIAWECMINFSWWWLGIGVGGGAALLMLLTDLLLVATDLCKVSVLRNTRSKGP